MHNMTSLSQTAGDVLMIDNDSTNPLNHSTLSLPVGAVIPPPRELPCILSRTSSVHTQNSATLSPYVHLATALLSFNDQELLRGVAKVAQLRTLIQLHPNQRPHRFVSEFKIDARKSCSNLPFKRQYVRGWFAAWIAQEVPVKAESEDAVAAVQSISTIPTIVLTLTHADPTSPSPPSKGWLGLLHQPTRASNKHPLVCLVSNSVRYRLSVFILRSDWDVLDLQYVGLCAHFPSGTANTTLVHSNSAFSTQIATSVDRYVLNSLCSVTMNPSRLSIDMQQLSDRMDGIKNTSDMVRCREIDAFLQQVPENMMVDGADDANSSPDSDLSYCLRNQALSDWLDTGSTGLMLSQSTHTVLTQSTSL